MDARIHIVAFDPRTKGITLSAEINARLGALPGAFADGKIHGRLDFYDGPWLWFCTYWAKYPEPSSEDYATGYRGGHIGRYNVRTGEVVDEGVPLLARLVAVPSRRQGAGTIVRRRPFRRVPRLGYRRRRKTSLPGRLPDGMSWGNRVLLLDERTGAVYSSDTSGGDPAFPLIRYDPATQHDREPASPDASGRDGRASARSGRIRPGRAPTGSSGP